MDAELKLSQNPAEHLAPPIPHRSPSYLNWLTDVG